MLSYIQALQDNLIPDIMSSKLLENLIVFDVVLYHPRKNLSPVPVVEYWPNTVPNCFIGRVVYIPMCLLTSPNFYQKSTCYL